MTKSNIYASQTKYDKRDSSRQQTNNMEYYDRVSSSWEPNCFRRMNNRNILEVFKIQQNGLFLW